METNQIEAKIRALFPGSANAGLRRQIRMYLQMDTRLDQLRRWGGYPPAVVASLATLEQYIEEVSRHGPR